MRKIELDIFQWTAIITETNGRYKKYFIEYKDGFYFLYVQRKKGKKSRWSQPQVIEKSKNILKIDFDEKSEAGLRSVIVA
ncbi:hypothetical protein [Silvanigrella aquatica]|uniref:Uncharacterized protein n=1 Tax=Silvanigrella aquatica TaxID=1915309 RepID=A0A1L4D4Y6_9BACT|nr:hypothetical protein [Silvanigrella aquatica]APJ05242.1 hypothetical protein AXG55_14565 [Silvanigrella aquatica]